MTGMRLSRWLPPRRIYKYKLRYIIGFGLVEMAISTYPKPTIYRCLYEDKGPGPPEIAFWPRTQSTSQINSSTGLNALRSSAKPKGGDFSLEKWAGYCLLVVQFGHSGETASRTTKIKRAAVWTTGVVCSWKWLCRWGIARQTMVPGRVCSIALPV